MDTLETLGFFYGRERYYTLQNMKNLKYVEFGAHLIQDVSIFSSIKSVEFLGWP